MRKYLKKHVIQPLYLYRGKYWERKRERERENSEQECPKSAPSCCQKKGEKPCLLEAASECFLLF